MQPSAQAVGQEEAGKQAPAGRKKLVAVSIQPLCRCGPHPTAYGYLILRSPNTFTSSAPEINPPTCAQNATPPMLCFCTAKAVAVPLKKFSTNQYPRMIHAGTH